MFLQYATFSIAMVAVSVVFWNILFAKCSSRAFAHALWLAGLGSIALSLAAAVEFDLNPVGMVVIGVVSCYGGLLRLTISTLRSDTKQMS